MKEEDKLARGCFCPVDQTNIDLVLPLAKQIWQATYGSILSQAQIDYMLPMMYSDERIWSEIESGYRWELYMDDTTLLGYLDYKLMDDNRVFLSKIYVDTRMHQKGVGYSMLQHVITFAKEADATAVYLTVNKYNDRAISFYQRNGFSCIKSESFDIGKGYIMDDFIYQLTL